MSDTEVKEQDKKLVDSITKSFPELLQYHTRAEIAEKLAAAGIVYEEEDV